MQTISAGVEAERMVVFLDACYSGAAGAADLQLQAHAGQHPGRTSSSSG